MTDQKTADAPPKEDAKPAKRSGAIFAVTANWNDDQRHPVASFHNRSDAEGFAAAYGGTVEAHGVAFTVGDGADHERAQDDADTAKR